MIHVQRWKVQNPAMFNFMKTIEGIADAAAVPQDHVYFFESTVNDNIWGTGVDTHPLKERILSIPFTRRSENLFPALHPEGKNQLGLALTVVYNEVCQAETVEDFVAALDPSHTLFECA